MYRTACVWVPQFELRSRIQTCAELSDRPVVIADVSKAQATVQDASAEALRLGVAVQMPLAAARALCPSVVVIPPDPERCKKLRDHVLAELYRFSPVVGTDGLEAFFVALTGLERIHPSEERLAQNIERALKSLALQIVVSVADTPVSAWVVAQAQVRLDQRRADVSANRAIVEIVPTGADRDYLARLPIHAIPMPEEIARLCHVLGVQSIGELQALPKGALMRRFGKAGELLERQACGIDEEYFQVQLPRVIEEYQLFLDQPCCDAQVLMFLLKSLLDQLMRQVGFAKQAVAALEVCLALTDSQKTKVKKLFRPPRPTLRTRSYLELINLWLAQIELPDNVDAVTVRAIEIGVATSRQLRLFERQQDDVAEAITHTLVRLKAAFGENAVVQPRLADTWRPEARLRWAPVETDGAQSGVKTEPRSVTTDKRPLSVMCLRSKLVPVTWRGAQLFMGRKRFSIVDTDGPYRISGEWWRADGYDREYWLLKTRQGDLLWVHRSGKATYLQGYAD